MKKSIVTLFTLFLLWAAKAVHVLDTDGKPLRNGGLYEMIAASEESDEGGIALAATGGETCPHTVVQANSLFPPSPPLPLTFPSPVQSSILSEGDPVSVRVTTLPSCAPSSSFNWDVLEDLPEGPAVKIGKELNTDFKIERASRGYKLVYTSPKHTESSGHLGISIDDDGFRRLVVTKNAPLHVFFRNLLPDSFSAAA